MITNETRYQAATNRIEKLQSIQSACDAPGRAMIGKQITALIAIRDSYTIGEAETIVRMVQA